MRVKKSLFTSDINREFLRRQVGAITKAISLMRRDETITLDKVFNELAKAEKEANFMCGFQLLEDSGIYKGSLKKYLVDKKFITVSDDGAVKLTSKGEDAARKSDLPPEIENQLIKS